VSRLAPKSQQNTTPAAVRRFPIWLIAVPVLGIALALPLFMNQPSRNGTQSLAQVKTEDIHALAFSFSHPNTLFLGHHDGLLISQDQGVTWDPTALKDADAMTIGSTAADPQRLYVAGHGVFLRSDDAGQTWSKPSSALQGADIHAFAVNPHNADHLFAYVEGKSVQVSLDGGGTWQSLPDALGRVTALVVGRDNVVYAGTANEGVFVSINGGQSWQRTGFSSFGTKITAVAFDMTTGDLYVAAVMNAGQSMLHRRLEATGAWEMVPIQGIGVIHAIAVSPHTSGTIMLVDQAKNVYRSSDNGQSWDS
jgi:photosystem II stability/assembly factor-like uncharacterized protein